MIEDEEATIACWTGEGDAEAFRAIVVRYSAMVYSTCRRILPTEGDAEEVAQECFEAFAVSRKPPTDYPGPWLHRVATNLSLKRIRSESRRLAREERYVREQEISSEAEWDDVYRFVDEAVAELPEKFRGAVVARYLEARTLESIAEQLDVSPRTVAYRVEKGVALIRAALRKRGITIGAGSLASMMGAQMAEAAVVPSSLTAGLGKLAIVGSRASSTVTAAKTIGGLVVMKKLGIAACVVLGGAFAFWSVQEGGEQERLAESTPESVDSSRTLEESGRSTGSTTAGTEESGIGELALSESGEDVEGIDRTDSSVSMPVVGQEVATGVEDEVSETDAAAAASISGLVYDSTTRKGLEGVMVTAVSDASTFEMQTDGSGRFQFAALAPGDYTISSTVPRDYIPPAEENMVNVELDEDVEYPDVEFAFQLGGTMEGVITFGDEPAVLKGFSLSHNMGVGEAYSDYIETDAAGAYRLTGLMPGGRTTHFQYTGAGTPSYKIPLIIDAGETTIVDVNFLSGTASIEGVVYRDSQTPIAAQIEVHSLEQTFFTTSDADGYYIVEGLPAGEVQVVGFTETPDEPDAPLQRRMFALELNDGDQLIQDIWFAETTIACSVSGIPETNVMAFFVALNGEVDFSEFNVGMLGVITRQRAAMSGVSEEGTGTLKSLEPGTYTIVTISFPGNPAAMESLKGEALLAFIRDLAVSNAEVITIEEGDGEVLLDFSF